MKGYFLLAILLLVTGTCHCYAEFCISATSYTESTVVDSYTCDPIINFEYLYSKQPSILTITAGILAYKTLDLLEVGDQVVTDYGFATINFLDFSTISDPVFVYDGYPVDCRDVKGYAVSPSNDYAYLGFYEVDSVELYFSGNITHYESDVISTPTNVYHGADEANDYGDMWTCDTCSNTNELYSIRENKDRYFNYADCLNLQVTTPSYFDCSQTAFSYTVPECSSVVIGTDIGIVEIEGIIWTA